MLSLSKMTTIIIFNLAVRQATPEAAHIVARQMEGSMIQTPGPRHEPHPAPVACPPRKRISTMDLMQGAREIIVLHQGEEYLLRITKSGKLILTK
jgi:hemin uptake protein HemP